MTYQEEMELIEAHTREIKHATQTIQALPDLNRQAEVAEAREDVAARLERLARLIRRGTTADLAQIEDAYREVGKLAKSINAILR